MSRPSLLNDNSCGFHARSFLMSSSQAGQVVRKLQAEKGYRDPTDDCEWIAFPVEQPCTVMNLPGDVEGLFPFRPWKENWQWSRIKLILAENWEYLRKWKGEITLSHSEPTKCPDESSPFSAEVSIRGDFWDDIRWVVRCKYSGYKTDEIWDQDRLRQLSLRKIVGNWTAITGYHHLISTRQASTRSQWEISITKAPDPQTTEPPLLLFGLRRGGDKNWIEVPGPEDGAVSEFRTCEAQRIDAKLAVHLFEAAITPLFGENLVPESILYKPKNEDVEVFREWAVPAFGGPWLQNVLGIANDRATPDDITDEVPAWSLYVVGYFKLVGRRRCLILTKEPGGWRLILTGKTITNPERHQFLREEIARMAGMTTETLWEPQKVGEGWLGVPG